LVGGSLAKAGDDVKRKNDKNPFRSETPDVSHQASAPVPHGRPDQHPTTQTKPLEPRLRRIMKRAAGHHPHRVQRERPGHAVGIPAEHAHLGRWACGPALGRQSASARRAGGAFRRGPLCADPQDARIRLAGDAAFGCDTRGGRHHGRRGPQVSLGGPWTG